MLAPLILAAFVAVSPEPRRFALVVGENHGMRDDPELQYALDDAQRTGETLLEVGSVRRADLRSLMGAHAEDLRQALSAVDQQLRREAQPNDQLLIYISSHADEGDLHLDGTRFPMRELNDFVQHAPVGVAILVVDSCRSGALTRLKGLRPLAGTEISVEAPELNGRIVMTSSGADEFAQESERLAGSYFTHHLLSGLRGAADTSGDGRVTLQEAYAYAYARTVETTFGSSAGIQHPSYRVDLKGRGDLVLSEPNRGRARLLLTSDVSREWLVLGGEGTLLVGHFVKAPGPALFAVLPGSYRVRARLPRGYREARVQVAEGASVEVTNAELGPLQGDEATRKGVLSKVRLGLGPSLGTSIVSGLRPLAGGEIRVEYVPARGLGPFQWFGASLVLQGAQALGDVRFRELELLLTAGPGFSWRFRWFLLVAGIEAGVTFARQDLLEDASQRWGVQPQLAARLGAEARLGAGWSLRLSGLGGVGYVRSERGAFVRPLVQGTLLVMYEL